jgi:hypothetical protein
MSKNLVAKQEKALAELGEIERQIKEVEKEYDKSVAYYDRILNRLYNKADKASLKCEKLGAIV